MALTREAIQKEFDALQKAGVIASYPKSEHQKQVESFLSGIGHKIPSKPELAPDDKLLAWAKQLIEEAMEYVKAAGVGIRIGGYDNNSGRPVPFGDMEFFKVEPGGDLVEIADGLADTMVVAVGGLSLCGIKDMSLLNEVNNNNLLKLEKGKLDPISGKFKKPDNHPRPKVADVLKAQGWEHENVHVPS